MKRGSNTRASVQSGVTHYLRISIFYRYKMQSVSGKNTMPSPEKNKLFKPTIFGNLPTLSDIVWLMEEGWLERNEELILKYKRAKESARHSFYEEMKDVDGFKQPTDK